MHTVNSGLRLLSRLCAILAAVAVGVTASFYVAEVVARYVFRHPLNWSGDMGSYMLCAAAFLSIPLITRHRSHIAVTVIVDTLPASLRSIVFRILELVTAAVLLVVAWFVIDLCIHQYQQGVLTPNANQIPRWWLTALMAFGLVVTSLNFIAPGDDMADEIREI